MNEKYFETGSKIGERSTVKKITYATLGAVMILAATLARTFAEAGAELAILLIVGLVLLIASADLPSNTRKVVSR